MEHFQPPPPVAATPVISTLADWVTVIGGIVAIAFAAWQLLLYIQLSANEARIKSKQADIDAVPANAKGRTSRSLVTDDQLGRLIMKDQEPLKHELKLLERDRRFILDKLLFAKK